ncbi:hypothetical protein JHV675_52800 [Mycobacterium avium subsp. hominissuis]
MRTTTPCAGSGSAAWVYTGGTGKDFVAVMRRLAAGEGPVQVVDDQIGSPTYVGDPIWSSTTCTGPSPAASRRMTATKSLPVPPV